MKNRTLKIIIFVLLGAFIMSIFSACGKKKYKLNLPHGFESEKTAYAEGETVKVSYPYFATDTNYSFYCDADDVKESFEEGYVFTFTMPARDVTFWEESYNSMTYIEPVDYTEKDLADRIDNDKMIFDYYQATVGTVGGDQHLEYVLYRWEEHDLLLARYSKFTVGQEVMRVCRVPVSYFYDCLIAVNRNGMKDWKDGIAITGASYVVKFKDGKELTRISSDDMPEDGYKAFADIKAIFEEAWKFYGPANDPNEGMGIIDDPVILGEDK